VKDDSLYVNLYAASEGAATVAGTKVGLTQTTNYPWTGAIRLAVSPEKPAAFTLRVRIPGWAQGRPVPSDLYAYETPAAAAWGVRVNGEKISAAPERGYLAIAREWRTGDVVELDFALPVQRVHGNEKIADTRGQVAFERGPVVYCVEARDGETAPVALTLAGAPVKPVDRPDWLGGVTTLRLADGVEAIPYFSWANRGLRPMAVWFKEAP
jgi:hypothetical protein